MNTLGKKIRTLRRDKGWSQEDVSRKLDISIPAFSKIETGVTDINLSRIEQIAALFEMSAVVLLQVNGDNQEHLLGKMDALNQKLAERDAEIIGLQRKVIELFDELKNSK
jgi:transcriptional regulator with XRE-family HTH domain